jgi:hypothetical protein
VVEQPIDTEPTPEEEPDLADGVAGDDLPDEVEPEQEDEENQA